MVNTWPGWENAGLLGEGSFGKVYRIRRTEFGTEYEAALKVMTIPATQSDVKAAFEEGMDEDSVTRYFRSFVEDIVAEFALMSQLKGNSHIVSYEDHMVVQHEDEIGWDILIRMELLTPLTEYFAKHPVNEEEILRLGIHICRALELCRRRGILHRDIKPENVFVSKDGDFKLGDFGVARVVERTISNMSRKGTYNYMAPEVYKNEEYGYQADLYSLGILLYRYLNDGRTPFLPPYPKPIQYREREQALASRMAGEPLPPPVHGSAALKAIVLKACAYRPQDRYASAEEMRTALEALRQQEHAGAPAPRPQPEQTAAAAIAAAAAVRPETAPTAAAAVRPETAPAAAAAVRPETAPPQPMPGAGAPPQAPQKQPLFGKDASPKPEKPKKEKIKKERPPRQARHKAGADGSTGVLQKLRDAPAALRSLEAGNGRAAPAAPWQGALLGILLPVLLFALYCALNVHDIDLYYSGGDDFQWIAAVGRSYINKYLPTYEPIGIRDLLAFAVLFVVCYWERLFLATGLVLMGIGELWRRIWLKHSKAALAGYAAVLALVFLGGRLWVYLWLPLLTTLTAIPFNLLLFLLCTALTAVLLFALRWGIALARRQKKAGEPLWWKSKKVGRCLLPAVTVLLMMLTCTWISIGRSQVGPIVHISYLDFRANGDLRYGDQGTAITVYDLLSSETRSWYFRQASDILVYAVVAPILCLAFFAVVILLLGKLWEKLAAKAGAPGCIGLCAGLAVVLLVMTVGRLPLAPMLTLPQLWLMLCICPPMIATYVLFAGLCVAARKGYQAWRAPVKAAPQPPAAAEPPAADAAAEHPDSDPNTPSTKE